MKRCGRKMESVNKYLKESLWFVTAHLIFIVAHIFCNKNIQVNSRHLQTVTSVRRKNSTGTWCSTSPSFNIEYVY